MSLPEDFDLHDVDFNALYQGGQMIEGIDLPSIPWDIGAAQPVVIEAERAGRFYGAVLDVGCGLGENAIPLASQGHQVTGVDAAPAAIEQARQRAGQRGTDVEFAVADAIMQDRGFADDHMHANWREQRAGGPGCPFCA